MAWYFWIGLVFGLPAGVITWLITAPLILEIDSKKHLYSLHWGKWIVAQFLQNGVIQLSIIRWTTLIDPWKPGKSRSRPGKSVLETSDSGTVNQHLPIRIIVRKAIRVLKTFQVHTFELSIDTDDYLLNAYLYPVFRLLSNSNYHLQINFTGDLSLKIIIENRPYRIIKAFIRS
ncbi:hypothetical protein [Runella sp.]|uniref:hypothetical protein n=1 Tax=Runella sp. TaxID=1960881 RepID=UPI003D1508D7